MIEIPTLHGLLERRPRGPGPDAAYALTPAELDGYLGRRRGWARLRWTGRRFRREGRGRALLLTADDGRRSLADRLSPLLERHEVSALVFVTTGFMDGDLYPTEHELAAVLRGRRELSLPERDGSLGLSDAGSRAAAYGELRRRLKPLDRGAREEFLERLAALNGYDRASFRDDLFLGPDAVAAIDGHPLVTVGAHGVSHVPLTELTDARLAGELDGARRRLEEVLGREVSLLAYPYGAHSFRVRRAARRAGYDHAFATGGRRAWRIGWWNRLRVPRLEAADLVGNGRGRGRGSR